MTEGQIRKKLSVYLDKHDFDIPSLGDMVDFAQEIATEATKELQEELDYAKSNCLFSDCDRVARLQEQIEKMKSDSKTAYIKGIRTMANALKECDRTEGAWTDYFEHTVDKVLKNLLKE